MEKNEKDKQLKKMEFMMEFLEKQNKFYEETIKMIETYPQIDDTFDLLSDIKERIRECNVIYECTKMMYEFETTTKNIKEKN